MLLVRGFVPRCPRAGARSEERGLMRKSSARLWPRHDHIEEQATERYADRERIGQLASPPFPQSSSVFRSQRRGRRMRHRGRTRHRPGGQDLARRALSTVAARAPGACVRASVAARAPGACLRAGVAARAPGACVRAGGVQKSPKPRPPSVLWEISVSQALISVKVPRSERLGTYAPGLLSPNGRAAVPPTRRTPGAPPRPNPPARTPRRPRPPRRPAGRWRSRSPEASATAAVASR